MCGLRRVALLVLVAACSPSVDPSGEAGQTGHTSTGDDGSGGASTAPDSTTTTTSSSATDAGTGDTGEVVSDCDPAFENDLPSGTMLWGQDFAAPPMDLGEGARGVAVGPMGRVYAVGGIAEPDGYDDGWTHALGASGGPQWDDRYEGEAALYDVLDDVVIDGAGNVLAVGIEEISRINWGDYNIESERVIVVLAYSSAGDRLWKQTAEVPEAQWLSGARADVAPDGRIVVGAKGNFEGGWSQMVMAELEPDGILIDVRTELLAGYRGQRFAALDIDPHGDLYVVATATPNMGEDQEWIGKWDSAGELKWHAGAEHPGASAMDVIADETGVTVLGRYNSQPTAPVARRPWLRRYDRFGEIVWTQQIEWPGEISFAPQVLEVDCNQQMVLLAALDGEPWLGRLSADGELLESIEPTDAPAVYADVATDPGGNLVVVGGLDVESPRRFYVAKLAW